MTKTEFFAAMKLNDICVVSFDGISNTTVFKILNITPTIITFKYYGDNGDEHKWNYTSNNEGLMAHESTVIWHIMTPEEAVAFVLEN